LESFAPNHARGPAVFGLALRQTEGLIGSIIHLLGSLQFPIIPRSAGALKR